MAARIGEGCLEKIHSGDLGIESPAEPLDEGGRICEGQDDILSVRPLRRAHTERIFGSGLNGSRPSSRVPLRDHTEVGVTECLKKLDIALLLGSGELHELGQRHLTSGHGSSFHGLSSLGLVQGLPDQVPRVQHDFAMPLVRV